MMKRLKDMFPGFYYKIIAMQNEIVEFYPDMPTIDTHETIAIGSNEWIKHKANGGHEWERYPLSMCRSRAYRTWSDKKGYQHHKQRFPTSLVVQYMETIPKDEKLFNIDILLKINYEKKKKKKLFNFNACLIFDFSF